MATRRLLPNSRSRRSPRGRRLLLITGTPGTGKRQLGGYLELQRSFVHVDLDSRETRTRLLRSGHGEFRSALAALAAANEKVVVTWTFASETQLAYVQALRALGFEWIWMDSDRGAAYDAFVSREAQLRPPRFVDAFETDGGFRALESVLGELRRKRPPLPRPGRPRVRVALPSLGAPLQRPAWAGVLAFAAAAAAAGGAFVAGVFGPAEQPVRVAVSHRPAHVAQLPVNAVFVPGKSLGGVELGDSEAKVGALWGRRFTVCHGCSPTTWFYMSATGNPFGAGVSFRRGRVTSVFTLGSPRGWHTESGIHPGQLLSHWNDPAPSTVSTACSGYGAISTRSADAVTSILTIGQSVYGFALSRPSEPICH